ncbi:MAG: tRNA (guanosine(46)-N7)-methyltransferase TrmB [Eubacteriaceae bacterium]|jgi:tRNA (guanine-N7-)-methyltransferase
MHLRRQPWMREELEGSPLFIQDPVVHRGDWRTLYPEPEAPLYLELGCGKGSFISELGKQNPAVNILGIDMTDVVLCHARRKIAEAALENVRITAWDIERIRDILSEEDRIGRIYINFCNPWPRRRQHKKRLVHTRRLEDYRNFLVPGAEIRFKTDDTELYRAALDYFTEADFEIIRSGDNLYQKLPLDNICTEHEQMYLEAGETIKYIDATLKER